MIRPLLIAHNEPLIAFCDIRIVEALQICSGSSLLCWQQFHMRKLVLCEEGLQHRKTLIKRLIIHAVVDPEIHLLELFHVRCGKLLLLHEAHELLKG